MEWRNENGQVVIVLPERFTAESAKRFAQVYKENRLRNETKFVVDASSLAFIDSMAIGTLLEAKKDLSKTQGELRIRGLAPDALEVFKDIGLSHIFELADSAVEGSVQALDELAFDYEIETVSDITVVHLQGMMYYPFDGESLESALHTALHQSSKVLVDLSRLTYLDSHSIGLFANSQKELGESGKEIRFCHANELMKDILETIGFDKIVYMYDSFDKALDDWKKW